jgi:Flp pilus assembly protein TadD
LIRTPYQTAQTALEKYDQEQSIHAAIDDFNRAIELDPRYADAYAKLGEAYLWLYRLTRRQEHIALSEQNATKARDVDDTRPSTWIALGMIHGQKGEYAEAEAAFSNAILRGPRMSLAYRELGRVQQRAGEADKAEASYRTAVQLDPDSWSNYSHLAAFLSGSKRLEEAEEMFLLATGKAPDNARAWSNLGGLYYLQRRFDEAEKALERAIALYDYGPALSNLATIKFRARRQYAEAARLLERAAQVAPRDYRILRNLAAAYYWTAGERDRAAGPLDGAIAVLEEARQIEPNDPELLAALADTYAMRGDGGTARRLIARVPQLAPSNGPVAVLAAATYETLGDREEALRQVATAFGAGVDRFVFDSDPTFAALVQDPRYATLGGPVERR